MQLLIWGCHNVSLLKKKTLWMLNLCDMNMGIPIQFFSTLCTLCTFGNLKQKLKK